jgi:hypothetical protein
MGERAGGGQGVLHSHGLRRGHLLSSKSRVALLYTTRKYYRAHAQQGKMVSWKHFMDALLQGWRREGSTLEKRHAMLSGQHGVRAYAGDKVTRLGIS